MEKGTVLKQDETEGVKHQRLPNLKEITKEEIQRRRERERRAREGDLSPRQIRELESASKRGKSSQHSLPLQVKTRSSKGQSEEVSQ
ncbi:hypothetical protein KY289_007970 [Solanum tuberosum]|nr:hypothetical protein KY289_007970 [Solanum tuberosum]